MRRIAWVGGGLVLFGLALCFMPRLIVPLLACWWVPMWWPRRTKWSAPNSTVSGRYRA